MQVNTVENAIYILIPVIVWILFDLSGMLHDPGLVQAMSMFAFTPLGRVSLHRRRKSEHEPEARSEEHVMSVLSHEFRTPLSIILGYADLLRSEVDHTHQEAVDAIIQSGRQLLSTLDSVLEWIEISEDRQVVRKSVFDLGIVFDDVVETHRARAGQKGLRLVSIAPVGTIEMNSDEDRIGRILGYVLDNAVKFTSRGEIRVSLSPSNENISMTIVDTGVGVDEGKTSDLSNPFIQGSTGDDRRYGGVGLGLTLATEGLRLMGGSISVMNRPEGGTRVDISIPRTLPDSVRKVA